jgi:hypothetical protein
MAEKNDEKFVDAYVKRLIQENWHFKIPERHVRREVITGIFSKTENPTKCATGVRFTVL